MLSYMKADVKATVLPILEIEEQAEDGREYESGCNRRARSLPGLSSLPRLP
jgi:hypothetical protein